MIMENETKIPNPPAYPVDFDPHFHSGNGETKEALIALTKGMTLLDHFAGLAMQAAIASCGSDSVIINYEPIAIEAYSAAKAMLKERQRHL